MGRWPIFNGHWSKSKDSVIFFCMEPIVQKEQSVIIYRLAHLLILPSSLAFYRKYYDLGVCNTAILLTSLNFWQNPVVGWQRNLDIVVTKSCMLFQSIRAYNSEHASVYYFFILNILLFYMVGLYYHYIQKDSWNSLYSHTMVHILGNIASILLYSGTI